MLRPYFASGGVCIPVTGSPPSMRPILPGLRLPLRRRRTAPGAAISFLLHAALILFLVERGRELLDTRSRTLGRLGGGGGGGEDGSGRVVVNFFALPASGAPAAVELPAPPHVSVADLSPLQAVRLDLPRLELPAVAPALGVPRATGAAASGSGQGPGGGGGAGTGAGPGVGPALGSGTGDAGSYIVAAPRMAILPPLASVPRSVAGRTYRVRFWVGADGRVTRIEIDPPIPDADYGREFQQRMMAYQFYPARTRDGRSVASVVTVPVRIGN